MMVKNHTQKKISRQWKIFSFFFLACFGKLTKRYACFLHPKMMKLNSGPWVSSTTRSSSPSAPWLCPSVNAWQRFVRFLFYFYFYFFGSMCAHVRSLLSLVFRHLIAVEDSQHTHFRHGSFCHGSALCSCALIPTSLSWKTQSKIVRTQPVLGWYYFLQDLKYRQSHPERGSAVDPGHRQVRRQPQSLVLGHCQALGGHCALCVQARRGHVRVYTAIKTHTIFSAYRSDLYLSWSNLDGSGGEAPFYMIGYFFLSGLALRAVSPPFGKCKDKKQSL